EAAARRRANQTPEQIEHHKRQRRESYAQTFSHAALPSPVQTQEPLLPIASLSTDTNAFTSTILNRHPLPPHPHESIIPNEPSAVNSTISTI
ncbi:15986_t:CDS:1, partial [Cetraspora pellucida]